MSASRPTTVSLLLISQEEQRRIDIALTPRERLMLLLLIARPGEFVRDEELLGAAYGLFEADVNPGALHEDIARLRAKLAEAIGHDPIVSAGNCGHRICGVRLWPGADV